MRIGETLLLLELHYWIPPRKGSFRGRVGSTPTPSHLTTTERAQMNIYLLTFLAVVIPFMAGYYLGVSDGKVEGRIEQFQAKR